MQSHRAHANAHTSTHTCSQAHWTPWYPSCNLKGSLRHMKCHLYYLKKILLQTLSENLKEICWQELWGQNISGSENKRSVICDTELLNNWNALTISALAEQLRRVEAQLHRLRVTTVFHITSNHLYTYLPSVLLQN